MNISSLAVRRGVTFSMLYLIVIGFGIYCLSQLKLDLFPQLKFPTVAVINTYTGVGPQEMETLVTRPIEQAVSSVKNVTRIRSTAKLGNSVTIVELSWGTDIDQAMMDIREKISLVKKQIPEEAREPIIFAFDPALQPILLISINSKSNLAQLREQLKKRVAPLIERVDGVASANVTGGQKREIQVMLNPDKLKSYKLTMSQVLNAIRASNVQIASGTLSQGKVEYSLQMKGTFQKVSQIRNVVVGYKGRPVPTPVYLKQVAKVVDGHEEITRVIESGGKQGMLMLVQKRSDANTVQVARRVAAILPGLEKRLPPGTKLTILFDQSDIITKSLSNLNTSVFQAFFLAIFVLLFFLRSIRSSFIVGVSIPVSAIATFSAMYVFDVTLNIISMAGLALAIGMLVDNSIVVLENIYRHFEMGKEPWDAAIDGSKEVSLAITASTLTTLAVFVPILFVPGIAGALFRDMVITICFSLTVSLIVAITLIPLMSSRLYKRQEAEVKEKKPGVFSRISLAFLSFTEGFFTSVLSWSLKYRKTALIIGFGTLFASFGLARFIETDFLPQNDDSIIMANFERSPGTSLKETMRSARKMEQIARKMYGPGIISIIAEAGIGEGFVALFGKGSYAGMLRIRLTSITKRPWSKKQIINGLRDAYKKLPDLKVDFAGANGAVTSGVGDIDIQLYGYDLKRARKLADEIKRVMEKVKGAADVRTTVENGKPELQIFLKRDRLQTLGLNPFTVGQTISTAFKGTAATLFRQGGNEFKVLVRLEDKFRKSVQHLKQLYIATPQGKKVTLESIADIRRVLGPVKIERQDQQRMATVAINVPGRNLGTVLARVRKALKKVTFPPDFYHRIGGKAEDFITSFQWLGVALLISVLLVYMVMASQFESLFEPFVILFSIPLAMIGVFVGLLITNTSLSVTALIGLVMLVGIVVNNAIVLIDYIGLLRREYGYGILEAAQEAGKTRMRPILMTAATTIFGMLPLALGIGEGGDTWAGLGRVVMGGLVSSTFLTLIIVPTMYTSISLFFEKRRLKKEAALAA